MVAAALPRKPSECVRDYAPRLTSALRGRRPIEVDAGKRGPPISNWGSAREFDEPIALPDGRTLCTLRDVGDYITKLPKAVHSAAEWQAAMEALILVAEKNGPALMAA